MKCKAPTIVNLIDPDGLLDKLEAAYRAEYARWSYRRIEDFEYSGSGARYKVTRNSSPNNDINADEYFKDITFTKRECPDYYAAEAWFRTYAGRAAMKCVTDILAK